MTPLADRLILKVAVPKADPPSPESTPLEPLGGYSLPQGLQSAGWSKENLPSAGEEIFSDVRRDQREAGP